MTGRRNLSAFWQFVDIIDPSRRRIAWTNICKMDRIGGKRPPSGREWSEVADISMAALAEEIESLSPKVIVFATSTTYKPEVNSLLSQLLYTPIRLPFDDGWTSCTKSSDGKFAIQTKHPQGWDRNSRDRVIDLVLRLMSGGVPE